MAIYVFVFAGMGLFGLQAAAHDQGIDPLDRHFERGDGYRCATRVQPRAVALNQYVLDNITLCLPWVEGLPREFLAALPASNPLGSSRSRPQLIPDSKPDPSLLPVWSPDRDQLANAQYSSSLRILRKAFRRISP